MKKGSKFLLITAITLVSISLFTLIYISVTSENKKNISWIVSERLTDISGEKRELRKLIKTLFTFLDTTRTQ